MSQPLRRKQTYRAHGQQVVVVKRKHERIEHVWMKVFLWALYLPDYPEATIEQDVPGRYKPDVVQMDRRRGRPVFWAEAGQVHPEKIGRLLNHHPRTHLALAKWDTRLDPLIAQIADAQRGGRVAPVDCWHFPSDSAERFIAEDGTVRVDTDHATRRRIMHA